MNLRRRNLLPVLVPLLALALFAPAAAQALERTVSASAEARVEVRNDSARTGFLVAAESRSKATALASASRQLRRVLAAVAKVPGVGAGDVSTGRISVDEVRRKGHPRSYRASERVSVVLHQPRKAGVLVEVAVAAGASSVNGPHYFVSDSEAAFTKALAAAFDRARARAATLAAQAGGTLGAVLKIDEGEGPGFLEEEDTGAGLLSPASKAAPVRPGTSTATAYVRVVIALQ